LGLGDTPIVPDVQAVDVRIILDTDIMCVVWSGAEIGDHPRAGTHNMPDAVELGL